MEQKNTEISLAEISHPNILRVHQYWLDKRAGRALPSRADVDPFELRFALGYICLIDVVRTPGLRFKFRLDGSKLSSLTGFDLTGKFADELEASEYRDFMIDVYQRSVEARTPLFFRHREEWQQAGMFMESVTLPLAADGETVDTIMDVVFPTDMEVL